MQASQRAHCLLLDWRVRRLIINADDFGLTQGVNRAIAEAHTRGVVTSATLMSGGAEFEDAVRTAKALPSLGVGCHVVLIDGAPLAPSDQVKTLVKKKTDGQTAFRHSLPGFAISALTGRLSESEIEREAAAQIRKLQNAGVALTHLDTHKHTHMFRRVLRPLLRAAKNCGVRAVRNPFEPVRISSLGSGLKMSQRALEIQTLRVLCGDFNTAVRDMELATTDGSIGVAATGSLDQPLLERLLENLPGGTWEFVCHPGYNDAALLAAGTRLRQSRAVELELLTSAATRAALERYGINLITYRDLG